MIFLVFQWENYKLKYKGVSLTVMKSHVKRMVLIPNGIILPLCFGGMILYLVYQPPIAKISVLHFQRLLGYEESQVPIYLIIIHTILQVYVAGGSFQTILFVITICSLIQKEFEDLNEKISLSCETYC